LSSLYKTSKLYNGYEFTNDNGDVYFVYMSEYYFEHPTSADEDDLVKVNHIGFSCHRKKAEKTHHFDPKCQATIMAIFLKFFNEKPDDAFTYVCDNKDNSARTRRITFGRWITEGDPEHQFFIHHAHIKSAKFYTTLIVRKENPLKEYFQEAFDFTIKKYYS